MLWMHFSFSLKLCTASFVAVSIFILPYVLVTTIAVCRYDTDFCMQPSFIITTGLNRRGTSDLSWFSSNFYSHSDVCVRTTPDPWHSRISREARGQVQRRSPTCLRLLFKSACMCQPALVCSIGNACCVCCLSGILQGERGLVFVRRFRRGIYI